MAIKPSTHFPPSRVNAGSTEYPQGSAKDETSSGANDGTPAMQASVWNDIWGFLQKLLSVAGITPSGDPDDVTASDYWDALTSNDVKAELASVDAGDVGGDRSVTNTGKGITFARSAVGAFSTTNVRTDLIYILSVPTFTQTSSGSKVWYTSTPISVLATVIPSAQITVLSASLIFRHEYSPGKYTQRICPCNILHSDTEDASLNITLSAVLSASDPNGADTDNHYLALTYQADW
jgi:hypothetical protein